MIDSKEISCFYLQTMDEAHTHSRVRIKIIFPVGNISEDLSIFFSSMAKAAGSVCVFFFQDLFPISYKFVVDSKPVNDQIDILYKKKYNWMKTQPMKNICAFQFNLY